MYKYHRFSPDLIQYAVWAYFRFNLSIRDVEGLLAQRGIIVSYEAIRLWINKFGPLFSRKLNKKHKGYGDTLFIDEVFIKIKGKQHYSNLLIEDLIERCRVNMNEAESFLELPLEDLNHKESPEKWSAFYGVLLIKTVM